VEATQILKTKFDIQSTRTKLAARTKRGSRVDRYKPLMHERREGEGERERERERDSYIALVDQL
jgi:hypothetical protein